MKIEIDLKDILHHEDYGSESVQESIRRQVVDKLTASVSQGIAKKIDEEISKAINEQIKKSLDEIRQNLIDQILDAEYIQVNQWGDRTGKSTTFRKELIRSINEEMVYKKTRSSYDRNSFTKAVDTVVEAQCETFKKEFNKLVDADYVARTKAYAVTVLKEKLGL